MVPTASRNRGGSSYRAATSRSFSSGTGPRNASWQVWYTTRIRAGSAPYSSTRSRAVCSDTATTSPARRTALRAFAA